MNSHQARWRARTVSGWLLLSLTTAVFADTSTLAPQAVSKGTSNVPVALQFPIQRSGDQGYDAIVSYHTIDGTALAGVDYSPATGTLALPAGAAKPTIPVQLAAQTGSGASLNFQLQLDSVLGVGVSPVFSAAQLLPVGQSALQVAYADFNGDGLQDLAVVDAGSMVTVLLNTTPPGAGTTSFAAPLTLTAGAVPFFVAAADLNGDGKPDLIVCNNNDNTISILLNTTPAGATTASFAAAQNFAVGAQPQYAAIADLDGDGRPDLIVSNSADNTISLLRNSTPAGAATFVFDLPPGATTYPTLPTDRLPTTVISTDLNADGKPDLVVMNTGQTTLSIMRNTSVPGSGVFSFVVETPLRVGSSGLGVASADIDGDGRMDLIMANQEGPGFDGTGSAVVLLNTTAPGSAVPSFGPAATFTTGRDSAQVRVADLNGDGKPDLIVDNTTDGSVSILRNITMPGSTMANFSPAQNFSATDTIIGLAVLDLNGDGQADVVVCSLSGRIALLLNTTPTPTATVGFAAAQTFATGATPLTSVIADINGDGKPDLVVANWLDSTLSVLLDTTSPGAISASFAAQQVIALPGITPYAIASADLDGDGRLDLIVIDDIDNEVAVLRNTTPAGSSSASFAAPLVYAVGSNPQAITVGDVNGDGQPDLIVANNGERSVSVLLNTTLPGTSPSFASAVPFAVGRLPQALTLADVDGDGRLDLIVANGADDTVSILLNSTAKRATSPSFAPQQTLATGADPASLAIADLNGDGKPDLVLVNRVDNSVSALLNLTAPGTTSISFTAASANQPIAFATGSTPQSVGVTDLDGDGKLDLVVANAGDNSVSFLRNTTSPGATVPSFATQTTFVAANTPYQLYLTDVNGDGRSDLVVTGSGGAHSVAVLLNTQLRAVLANPVATGTIVHDYLFAAGFE